MCGPAWSQNKLSSACSLEGMKLLVRYKWTRVQSCSLWLVFILNACRHVASLCPQVQQQLKVLPYWTHLLCVEVAILVKECEKRKKEHKKRMSSSSHAEKYDRGSVCSKRRVHGREQGARMAWVCKGVNKVRRAVARTTTNPELALVPSQCPTHPSFAPSIFFSCILLSDSLKPQSNEYSSCFCSLNGAAA